MAVAFGVMQNKYQIASLWGAHIKGSDEDFRPCKRGRSVKMRMSSSEVSAEILAILTVARSTESLTVMRIGVEEMGEAKEMTLGGHSGPAALAARDARRRSHYPNREVLFDSAFTDSGLVLMD